LTDFTTYSIIDAMTDIKSLSDISTKWKTVTPGRADEYRKGVTNPNKSWSENTQNAKEAYNSGVQAAISNNSFSEGVAAAGDSAWKAGALNKGVTRWPQGVSMSGEKYQSGFAPYHSIIQGTTLSPRGAKGDPRNYTRVQEIGQALHEAKVGK
jgi:hypothetical protein